MAEDLGGEVRSLRRGSAAVIVVALSFVAFEILKESALPGLSKWESHLLSIGFVALLAVVALVLFTRVLRSRSRVVEELRLENARRERAEARFRDLLELAPDAMLIAGDDDRIVLVNEATEKLFGYSREELVGGPLENLLPERFRDRHRQYRREYGRNPHGRSMGSGLDLWGRRKDGSEFPVDIGLSPLATEEGLLVIGSVRDVSERRRVEDELHDLGGRLIHTQEDERRRIARELHDDLNQRLAMLALDLDLIARTPPASAAETSDRMRELSAQVKEMSSGVHELTRQLHPSQLEQLGLVAAIGGLCRDLAEQRGIEIEFVCGEVAESIPADVALCVYRVLQEALSNVVKHSGAALARVELGGGPAAVQLRVSDSGAGFDPHSPARRTGLGLVSMRERLRLVGGEFSVHSEPSRGTRIEARVPLAAA